MITPEEVYRGTLHPGSLAEWREVFEWCERCELLELWEHFAPQMHKIGGPAAMRAWINTAAVLAAKPLTREEWDTLLEGWSE